MEYGQPSLAGQYAYNQMKGIKVTDPNVVMQDNKGFVPGTFADPKFRATMPQIGQQQQNPWFGQGGYLQTGAQVANALSGLAGAYTGLKGLGLAEDQFAYEKGLANANLANQADLINEQRLNATNVGLSLAGNTMTDAQREAARNKTLAGNVQRTI